MKIYRFMAHPLEISRKGLNAGLTVRVDWRNMSHLPILKDAITFYEYQATHGLLNNDQKFLLEKLKARLLSKPNRYSWERVDRKLAITAANDWFDVSDAIRRLGHEEANKLPIEILGAYTALLMFVEAINKPKKRPKGSGRKRDGLPETHEEEQAVPPNPLRGSENATQRTARKYNTSESTVKRDLQERKRLLGK